MASMDVGPKIAQVAALVGDPARANMLAYLMDGRALTASELAYAAGVAPPTASEHLAKLCDGGLLVPEKQGRHRYFRLASPLVGQMLESIMVMAQSSPARHRSHWRGGDALRNARTCYDHMAGRLAVQIMERLLERGFVVMDADGGRLMEAGRAFLDGHGVQWPTIAGRRAFCRPCLDWSERRPHLAGILGQVLLRHAEGCGWVQRVRDSRALSITSAGKKGFAEMFDVEAS